MRWFNHNSDCRFEPGPDPVRWARFETTWEHINLIDVIRCMTHQKQSSTKPRKIVLLIFFLFLSHTFSLTREGAFIQQSLSGASPRGFECINAQKNEIVQCTRCETYIFGISKHTLFFHGAMRERFEHKKSFTECHCAHKLIFGWITMASTCITVASVQMLCRGLQTGLRRVCVDSPRTNWISALFGAAIAL